MASAIFFITSQDVGHEVQISILSSHFLVLIKSSIAVHNLTVTMEGIITIKGLHKASVKTEKKTMKYCIFF